MCRQMFQSLIGFKINWNYFLYFSRLSRSWFQSLIGFKINWNLTVLRAISSDTS
ncbi:unknown protein [Microcystis aeruginosa NIES-843]|uniref:Uncharacterized protein n=1 Tax=Microcystis aeruginosa (strain NIES-843 / IAM M-2473) TaxID=449447 RepID=B0JKY1_MICAN|nr:unknown protein [Microcystis aeruginosa NIES-843]